MENSIVILVVEDELMIQSVVQEALEEGGFEIVIASSGEEAARLLAKDAKRFRALLTDVNLGRDRMDGWDVGRLAREADPAFPVVYMTGDSAADWAAHGVPNSLLITKPFAPAQIVSAVTQLLNTPNPGAPPTV